jgi:outer membrane protein
MLPQNSSFVHLYIARFLAFSLALAPAAFISAARPVRAELPEVLSLPQAYELALKQSEPLMRNAEEVKAAEARYKEAWSHLYPQVHFGVTQRLRDGSSDSNGGSSGVSFTETGTSSRSKHPFQTSLTVEQPLFTGFRDFYIIEAAEFDINASRYDQTRHTELLYSDVADIFLQIVYFEKVLKLYDKTDQVLGERISDLKRFIDLGKSRASEIEAAEADRADLGAAKAQTQGLLDASREMLAFLVGRPAAELALSSDNVPYLPPGLDELIASSRNRSDIRAASERVSGAGKELIASERERWPVVSLTGNAYPYSDPDDNRNWDLLVKMDLPIFEGGGIDARVEQSRAKERSAELSAQELRRIAEREVRVSYSQVTAARSEAARLKKLLEATRKNYQSQRKDYELGVVTNLEVLDAIRSVQNAERRLLEAETTISRNFVRLQVAAGVLP